MDTRNAIESAVFDVPWGALRWCRGGNRDLHPDVWLQVHCAVRDALPEDRVAEAITVEMLDRG